MPAIDEAKYVRIAQTVFDLRLAGHSMHAVAESLGEPISTCYKAWAYWVDKIVQPKAAEARTYEVAVLDRLALALDDRVRAGDVAAVREVRGISERRSRLLGLDMPTQVEHRVAIVDAVDDEIMRLTAQLGSAPVPVEP